MVILVDLSSIFLASPLSILVNKWHGLPKLLSLFKNPIDLLLSCLSQTKHPDTINGYRMLSSFIRLLPFKCPSYHLSGSRNRWWPSLYCSESNLLRRFLLDQTTRRYTLKTFTSFQMVRSHNHGSWHGIIQRESTKHTPLVHGPGSKNMDRVHGPPIKVCRIMPA